MTRPCACAPGCRNTAMDDERLCESCHDAFVDTPASVRYYETAATLLDAERSLADWARTRSKELAHEREDRTW